MKPDRRSLCRRIQLQQKLPIELRSGVERRRSSRRGGEPVAHLHVTV
jgi:hypothetical protein